MLDLIGLKEVSTTEFEKAGDSYERHNKHHSNENKEGGGPASVHRLGPNLDTIFKKGRGYVDLPWNWLHPSGSGLSTGREAVHKSASQEYRDDTDPGDTREQFLNFFGILRIVSVSRIE